MALSPDETYILAGIDIGGLLSIVKLDASTGFFLSAYSTTGQNNCYHFIRFLNTRALLIRSNMH